MPVELRILVISMIAGASCFAAGMLFMKLLIG